MLGITGGNALRILCEEFFAITGGRDDHLGSKG